MIHLNLSDLDPQWKLLTSDDLRREGNRQISRRIKRPPSQRISNEMAVSIFIMV